jgi:hypothetical protein
VPSPERRKGSGPDRLVDDPLVSRLSPHHPDTGSKAVVFLFPNSS